MRPAGGQVPSACVVGRRRAVSLVSRAPPPPPHRAALCGILYNFRTVHSHLPLDYPLYSNFYPLCLRLCHSATTRIARFWSVASRVPSTSSQCHSSAPGGGGGGGGGGRISTKQTHIDRSARSSLTTAACALPPFRRRRRRPRGLSASPARSGRRCPCPRAARP